MPLIAWIFEQLHNIACIWLILARWSSTKCVWSIIINIIIIITRYHHHGAVHNSSKNTKEALLICILGLSRLCWVCLLCACLLLLCLRLKIQTTTKSFKINFQAKFPLITNFRKISLNQFISSIRICLHELF